VRILLAHCDHRPFEIERFSQAWAAARGAVDELLPLTPSSFRARGDGFPSGIAGVLLSGGPDVEPRRYGREPQAGVELDLDPPRDELDLFLLERAAELEWPVLAVCYGCQVLAVFHGGTLIQDLSPGGMHSPNGRRREDPAHTLELSATSRFLPWLPDRLAVNSRHHQAIEEPGRDLAVVAQAPDGVVEAVEETGGNRFVVGVQWHPENMLLEPHLQVFRSFREACRGRFNREEKGDGG